jgi:acyl carrier protein
MDRLVELWKQALRTEDVTPDDDFFELGGNSIAAVKLVPVLKQHFGVEPHISAIFDHATPRRLAVALTAMGAWEPGHSPGAPEPAGGRAQGASE